MTNADRWVIAFGIAMGGFVLAGVTACEYNRSVIVPLRMADKGMCWQAIATVYAYAPCPKAAGQ